MVANKEVMKLCREAKQAAQELRTISSSKIDKALKNMAEALVKNQKSILVENAKDIKNARKKKLSPALIDRLMLNKSRIESMSKSLKEVAGMMSPLGEIIEMYTRPNGLKIGKMRIAIGVVLIIYESRPNVTSDCVGLCLKSGNVIILRGGSEAFNSNRAIFNTLKGILDKMGFPKGAINMVMTKDRKILNQLFEQNEFIDLCIPRGGESLIRNVTQNSRIPIIKHYKGVCHTYVDKEASLDMAIEICYNAKVQRPGVCNAMETLLVHKDIAKEFLAKIDKLYKKAGVQIRGCKRTKNILRGIKEAKEEDWYEEYLSLTLSVKVVNNLEEAIAHIAKYGSGHSDAIVSNNYDNSIEFLERVDSACVYVNASTRFTDGGEFGLGTEMGISTDKLHARGPMGLKELTTYKYIIFGDGQIRK